MLGSSGGKSGFGWVISNQTVPSTTGGTAITPGSGSKGTYTQLLNGSSVLYDVYGLMLQCYAGNTSATIRDVLLDIGIDQNNGTSYTQIGGISDIFIPQCSNCVDGGRWFYFPLFIKAGTKIVARAQANNTSTVRVRIILYGMPTNVENIAVATYSETIGVSGNGGTPFTCGNSAAWGNWTEIGTTTKALWYWQLAWGHNVGTTTAQAYMAELAFGDSSNKHTIISLMPMFNPGTAERSGNPLFDGIWSVPAGATLYVRGSASGTAETTEAVAIGLGG